MKNGNTPHKFLNLPGGKSTTFIPMALVACFDEGISYTPNNVKISNYDDKHKDVVSRLPHCTQW